MIRKLLPMIALLVALQIPLLASPLDNPPTDEVSKKLIAGIMDINESTIRIASTLTGSHHAEDGFEQRWTCRVTAIHPLIDQGRMIRRVRCYDFSWNNEYGWFHQQITHSLGREEIWIWSETQGQVIIR